MSEPERFRAVFPDGHVETGFVPVFPGGYPIGTKFYFDDEEYPRFTVLSRENGITRVGDKRLVALDLCCGKGGWAKGLKAAGWSVIGIDVDESFREEYPGAFLQADVTSAVWRGVDISLVVASPPCEQFSRHDMPWLSRKNPPPPDPAVWRACERIARECAAPLVLENVRGAQKFMGKAVTHYGSQYLWGDVPPLLPEFPGWKNGERQKQFRTSAARADRAMIPFELAYAVGKYYFDLERK